MREAYNRHAVLLCDIRKAYNEISRLACIKAILRTRGLDPLARMAWATLSFPTELLLHTVAGNVTILIGAGVRQGDPISTIVFCAGLQQALEAAHNWFVDHGPEGGDGGWADFGAHVSAFADDFNSHLSSADTNRIVVRVTCVEGGFFVGFNVRSDSAVPKQVHWCAK